VVLALLAARGVLLPVRELRRGARGLAAGRLDTRLPVRGRDELADLVRTFNHTAGELERNVTELRRLEEQARRFAADVAHELRTPLAAMTAVTDILDEEAPNLPGDAGIAARLVSAETRRLAALVENLMEISRFDAGRAVLRAEEVDLAELVTATLAARGWTGQVGTELPAGLTARLDRARIDVVLANLVGNALRHGAPPVTVAVAPLRDDRIAVRVTDHGAGVPDEVAEHVFDRFFKADSSRARSQGSGLGLAIARENAHLHGGTVELGRAGSGGAVFTLVLPRGGPD
jgi:two-component system sensor histidine kinase MtrB